MKPDDFIMIVTTCDNREALSNMAHRLVEKNLAACVQLLGPIESTYRWEGKVETATEWLCQIKTTASLYDQVEAEILHMHPYTTPEIIALPLVRGHQGYLSWIVDSVISR